MHASLSITRAEERKRVRPKVEEGIQLALKVIQIAEGEENLAWLEA